MGSIEAYTCKSNTFLDLKQELIDEKSDNAMGPKGGSITRVVLRSADFTPLEYACIHMYSIWGAGKVRIRVFEYLSACIHHLGLELVNQLAC